jgi:hypothetical protein
MSSPPSLLLPYNRIEEDLTDTPVSFRLIVHISQFLLTIVGTIAGAPGEPGEQMVKFDVGTLSPGIYFCRMRTGDRQHTVPVVVR